MTEAAEYKIPFLKQKGKAMSEKEFEEAAAEILRNMSAVTKPFEEDTEEEKQKRRERAAKDYEWFCLTYLPHYFSKPFGEIHRELISYCETGGKSLNAVAYPREHGKSAHTSFAKPLQLALCDISPYSIIVSDTSDLAEEMIMWIKLECEENQRIIQDFGNPVTEGWWEKGDIVILGKNRIQARGYGQRIRGTRYRQFRPFYIVIDDLENDINVKNKKLVKAKYKWIMGAVYGSLADNGTLIMVGTMLDKDSVLSRMIKNIRDNAEEFQKRFKVKGMNAAVYSAIIDENTPNERPCWPEGKTLAMLHQIKFVVGDIVFAAEFQNKPMDTGAYKLEWMRPFDFEIISKTNWQYFSGSDPSASSDQKNDFKAHVVIALDPVILKRYVVESWIQHAEMFNFYDAFISLFRTYRPLKCGFEKNGYQNYLASELVALCKKEDLWPNFVLLQHSDDKVARCSRWVLMFKDSDILFYRNYSDNEILVKQLNSLGEKDHDDGPDALDMAIEVSQGGAGDFEFKASGQKRESAASALRESFYQNQRPAAYVRGLL